MIKKKKKALEKKVVQKPVQQQEFQYLWHHALVY